MHIQSDDPYPGRCRNFRQVPGPYGSPENVRCLEYEHERHVCRFPEIPVPTTNVGWAGQISTWTQRKPEPWVRPE